MSRSTLLKLASLLPVAVVVLVCSRSPEKDQSQTSPSYRRAERIDLDRIRFDDGDTFYLDNEPIRILGIDTPETRSPGVGIMEDQPYGPAAAESTRALMSRALVIEIVKDGRGSYGRRLAHIFVDGQLLATRLIAMGLAYENVSHFGDNGFPDLADSILIAAEKAPKPKFMPPHLWRKKNQRQSR